LSQYKVTGVRFLILRSCNKARSQIISQQVVAIARYSASAEERATTDCFFTFQEIGEEPSSMQKPVVDFLITATAPV